MNNRRGDRSTPETIANLLLIGCMVLVVVAGITALAIAVLLLVVGVAVGAV